MLQLFQSYQVKELQTARNEPQHSDLPTRIKRFAECTLQLMFADLKHISESSFKRSPNRQVDEFYLSVFKVKFSGFPNLLKGKLRRTNRLANFIPTCILIRLRSAGGEKSQPLRETVECY